ncbi:MAG TPA: delta-60 repeat domain-containing protein [Verrucomicrobiota bacterium]|nr:hypothetical protein [Verrucomicrobiales bacterium]HRI14918.1 delta-60 repeat domain-containing protein [Verrucomicrobiota bacterium]
MKGGAFLRIGCLMAAVSSALAQPAYTVDPNFNPVITMPGGGVKAVAVESDGRIYVAGAFAAIDGIPRPGLARLKSTGGVDDSFPVALAGGDVVELAVLQPDGKLLVAGSSPSSANPYLFTRINPDGSRDPGFQAAVPAYWPIAAILVQGDGKSIVAVRNPGPPEPSLLVRLDSAGRRDPSFTQVELKGGTPHLTGMLLQPDGRIVIWGYFTKINGAAQVGVARLKADGSLDTTFRHTLQSAYPQHPWVGVQNVLLLPDGQLIVSGAIAGGSHRLNADGSTRERGLNVGLGPIFLQADGKMIIDHGGNFTRTDRSGQPDWSEIEQPDGGLSLYRNGRALALLPDGGVLMEEQGEIKKLTTDGDPDPSFGATTVEVPGQLGDLIQQTDGKVVLIGDFSRVNGTPRPGLARLNTDGSLDLTFVPDSSQPSFFRSIDGAEWSGLIRFQPWDRNIIVSGIGESGKAIVARVKPDGSRDLAFNPPAFNAPEFGWMSELALHSDGTLYVAYGAWNKPGKVVRLKADGSVDAGFQWQGDLDPMA